MDQPKKTPPTSVSSDVWTLPGFLAHFMSIDKEMPDRAFAFILGAGASRSSGIPTAQELVDRWVDELRVRFDSEIDDGPTAKWATAGNLGIVDFEYARRAEFYPQVFHRRFDRDIEEGYAALEHLMARAEPSLGYSVLAKILTDTRHSIVITPNFDNLVADALGIYSMTSPLVVAHESLAHFARPRLRRPLVAKIHRDLLLAPMNRPAEVAELGAAWTGSLAALLKSYTPIVIGYGGNDGSLMGMLDGLPGDSIPGGLLWCYRIGDGLPREAIQRLVEKHRGAFIPILGFDEVMMQINERFGFPLLGDSITEHAIARAKQYNENVEEIKRRLSIPTRDVAAAKEKANVQRAIAAADQQQAWAKRVREEPDKTVKEELYQRGIALFPLSTELVNNYGVMLLGQGRFGEAIEVLRQGVAKGLHHQTGKILTNLSRALRHLGENSQAIEVYELAESLYPRSPRALVDFGACLIDVGDLKAAREKELRAIDAAGEHRRNDVLAEALFYLAIIERVDGRNDGPVLARLKELFASPFARYPYASGTSVPTAVGGLDDADFYSALAKAVDGAAAVATLGKFPRWQAVIPASSTDAATD